MRAWIGLYLSYPMKAKKPKAAYRSPFERFAQVILRVPKDAVNEAEARRGKRSRQSSHEPEK